MLTLACFECSGAGSHYQPNGTSMGARRTCESCKGTGIEPTWGCAWCGERIDQDTEPYLAVSDRETYCSAECVAWSKEAEDGDQDSA